MSKAHIDKVFEQKLTGHRSEPPIGAWDKLETQLEDKKRKKVVMWYQVAAVVAMLLVGGWFVLRTPQVQTGEGIADTGGTATNEEEEVQNLPLAATGATNEEEEVQNRSLVAIGATNEEEEVQNLMAMATGATNEEEEVQNVVAPSLTVGPSAAIAASTTVPSEVRTPVQTLAPLPSLRIMPEFDDHAISGVAVAIVPISLPEPPKGTLEVELLPEDISWNDAVALVKNVKEGDVTIGQIREAKDKFSLDQVSWASLREAKNELLSFND